jgi:hypothetical protein
MAESISDYDRMLWTGRFALYTDDALIEWIDFARSEGKPLGEVDQIAIATLRERGLPADENGPT